MTVEVSAYKWVPDFAQGFVRDLRVRWALEEAGVPYRADLIDVMNKGAAYSDWQPFAQVPAYRDGEVEMFESGAIVIYLAGKHEALAPRDGAGQARVITWVLAALNSIEIHVAQLGAIDVFHAGEAWTKERRPQVIADITQRLQQLSDWLGDKPYLEGRFTAGDLMMATVLRELDRTELLSKYANLDAYLDRCTARPAFKRAMDAQLQPFRENEPA
ncbi:glutathione S-transferase family protein [Caulobacter sp. SLTY]|uniref:glutathione S-transferase family protein n=1 Tax=Caulobacter sp. SLTY TaxID=2683262 RepID=UPI001411BD86|nr:glutathione S-transferase family protein [Caulobacter sp. SLTY]NBB15775.1 glutathione S-transferase family protein [Caulobacter sp. SLTY]